MRCRTVAVDMIILRASELKLFCDLSVQIREVLQFVSRTLKLFRDAFNQCDSPSSLSENAELRKIVVESSD